MKHLKHFVVFICMAGWISGCMSDEELRQWYAAQAKAEAQAREYNRVLDYATIDEITTCKHGSLDKVRKNLILIGYEIESLDNQVLTTKWRQYSNDNNRSKYYDKISFVKVAPNKIKFKERLKHEYLDKEEDRRVETVKDGSYKQRLANQEYACKKNRESDECKKEVVSKDKTYESVSYRDVTRVNEYDKVYYARNYDSDKSYGERMCGGDDPVNKIKGKSPNNQKNK